jgi:hypothetical protein
MLASLALISLLQAPTVGADGITLAQPRFTHGVLGPARASDTVKPGDSLVLAFEIDGITSDKTGKAAFSTAVDVSNAAGKSIFQQPTKKFQEFLPLGDGMLPAFAQIDLGLNTPAGKYTMAVTVADVATGKSTTVKKDFTVAAGAFDLVRLSVSGDADGLVPLAVYGVGQPFFVHAAVVGFQRDTAGAKQPKVNVELRVLGSDLKPILAQPFTGAIDKDVPANATSLPIRFYVPLNKAGSYYIQLAAKDELGKGGATLAFPITVLPNK